VRFLGGFCELKGCVTPGVIRGPPAFNVRDEKADRAGANIQAINEPASIRFDGGMIEGL
jgi:hypothetical protein